MRAGWQNKGSKYQSYRHALSAKGIKTKPIISRGEMAGAHRRFNSRHPIKNANAGQCPWCYADKNPDDKGCTFKGCKAYVEYHKPLKYGLHDYDYGEDISTSDSIADLKFRAKLSFGIPITRWKFSKKNQEWYPDDGTMIAIRKQR